MNVGLRFGSLLASVFLVACVFVADARAQSGTWNTTTNGTWTTAGNWVSNQVASGTDNNANFTFNITNDLNVTLGADRTIGNITFTDSTTSSHNMTISGANVLTMNVTTGTPIIDVTQSGRTLTISSQIAGNDGLQKNGSGSLTLSGANTITGGLTINAGTVTAGAGLNSNAVFLGATSGSAAATLSHIGGDLTIPSNITVQSGSSGLKTLSQNVSGSSIYSGNFLLNGNLTWSNNSAATILKTTGVVSGNGSMTFNGNSSNGTIGFGGANTYTGGTTIDAGGIVAVTADSTGTAGNPTNGSFGAGTAAVVLNGGQLRSSTFASRTVGNVVTLAADTTFVTIATEKTLGFSGPVTMTASRTLTVDVGNTVVGQGVTISGAIGDGGNGFGLTKAGAASGLLTLSGNNTFSGATAITGGILSLGNSLALQNSPLDTATSIAGNGTAGLRSTVTTLTLGGLTGNKNFASSGGVFTTTTGGYTSVTALTLNPGIGATPTYSGVIANGASGMNLIKSGVGTQTLNGTNTFNGTTTVSGGTLALGASGSINNTSGVVLATGTFDVSAKGGGGYSTGNLSGNGNVVGSLTVSNLLAIGTSPGTIGFENLTLGGAATYLYEVTGGGSTADLGNVSGTLNLGSATLSMSQLGAYTLGDKFTLFGYNSGNLTGTFGGLGNGTTFLAAGGNWTINYADASAGLNGGTGNLFVTVMAVPEPAGIALLAAGALGGLWVIRQRRHIAKA